MLDDTVFIDVRADAAPALTQLRALDTTISQISATSQRAGQDMAGLVAAGSTAGSALSAVMEKAATGMERALSKFARTGKLSINDLRNVAVSMLDQVYNQAVNSGLNALFGGSGSGSGSGSGGGLLGGLFQSILSLSPRASGGPVQPGRAFLVGESGPELFLPGQAGRIAPTGQGSAGARVNVTINMAMGQGGSAGASEVRQSAAQVATAVARAVSRAQRNR